MGQCLKCKQRLYLLFSEDGLQVEAFDDIHLLKPHECKNKEVA
jgi:hypothetical protein